MKKDLTNFDRYLLSREAEKEETKVSLANNEMTTYKTAEKEINPKYADYIVMQLRRTTPSKEKVMTQEEFESNNYNNVFVNSVETESVVTVKKSPFNKFGKIFLLFYVIIMLALALVVLMNAYSPDSTDPASASSVQDEELSLQTMPESYQETESEDWFDKICDSIK